MICLTCPYHTTFELNGEWTIVCKLHGKPSAEILRSQDFCDDMPRSNLPGNYYYQDPKKKKRSPVR